MKTLRRPGTWFVVALALLLCGVWIGRWSAHSTIGEYRTDQAIVLVRTDGSAIGELPLGTPVISDLELDPDGELGWKGCVPIYFGTSSEASEVLAVSEVRRMEGFSELTINALKPNEVP